VQHKQTDRANVVVFEEPQTALSWAPYGGGMLHDVRTVVNFSVTADDMRSLEQLRSAIFEHLAAQAMQLDEKKTVILLTSVPAHYCFKGVAHDESTGLFAQVFATAGLGNARAIGDRPEWNEELYSTQDIQPGTINLIISVNRGLTPTAQIELSAIVAKVAMHIVQSFGLVSKLSNSLCCGTGTDCVVICAPRAHETILSYAGMHTMLRSVVEQAVDRALRPAIQNWIDGRRS
jgi:adenosylcobinamide amidohydrolase